MQNEELMMEILLEEVVKKHASDLHIQVGLPPMLRVDGSLSPVAGTQSLDEATVERLVFRILDEDQQQILLKDKEFDFSFAFGDLGRFRVNAFHERGNLAAALRLIPNEIKSVQELGLPPVVLSFADYPRGLVLVTGPTGSGKSTTLAALVDKVNSEKAQHIITIEDPIEYMHTHNKCLVNQRELGADTQSFGNALRGALRQDPDVILVGEMRDKETIEIALRAAETGHLVLSTLHTVGAVNTMDRIIDVFPAEQQEQIRVQLSAVMEGVVSQQLMRTATGKGRVAAFEIMLGTPAIRNLIREGKTHQLLTPIQTGAQLGMITMDTSLMGLYRRNVIDQRTLLSYSVDRAQVEKSLGIVGY